MILQGASRGFKKIVRFWARKVDLKAPTGLMPDQAEGDLC